MQYDWILFDADETLFSFDAFSGLQTMFFRLDVEFKESDFDEYQMVNRPLWIQYQNGEISAKQLQEDRFLTWSERLDISPTDLNCLFLDAMSDVCQPLDGVKETIPLLSKNAKLGIITNGFTQLQHIRLEKTGLIDYFDIVIISEEVGVAKPDVAIFDHAIKKMKYSDKTRILMVGDNPDSDILGGNNAGIATCWLNVDSKPTPKEVYPSHIVRSWDEIRTLLLNE